MTLLDYPKKLSSLGEIKVDWSKTKCWSTGYHGSLYLNVKGRESQGIVDPKDYDKILDELIAKLKDIPGENRSQISTKTWKRADTYFGGSAKYGPDLFIDFDDGRFGTSELLGHGRGNICSRDVTECSTNVARSLHGHFVIAGPDIPARQEYKKVSVLDIAPTALDVLGLPILKNMEGQSILSTIKKEKEATRSEEKQREKVVRSRLEALGY